MTFELFVASTGVIDGVLFCPVEHWTPNHCPRTSTPFLHLTRYPVWSTGRDPGRQCSESRALHAWSTASTNSRTRAAQW